MTEDNNGKFSSDMVGVIVTRADGTKYRVARDAKGEPIFVRIEPNKAS